MHHPPLCKGTLLLLPSRGRADFLIPPFNPGWPYNLSSPIKWGRITVCQVQAKASRGHEVLLSYSWSDAANLWRRLDWPLSEWEATWSQDKPFQLSLLSPTTWENHLLNTWARPSKALQIPVGLPYTTTTTWVTPGKTSRWPPSWAQSNCRPTEPWINKIIVVLSHWCLGCFVTHQQISDSVSIQYRLVRWINKWIT